MKSTLTEKILIRVAQIIVYGGAAALIGSFLYTVGSFVWALPATVKGIAFLTIFGAILFLTSIRYLEKRGKLPWS